MRPTFVALALAAAAFPLSSRALAQTMPPAPETRSTDVPAPAPAPAPPAPPPQPPRPRPAIAVDVSTLEHLREAGILSEAEYELALRDIGASTGTAHAAGAGSLVVGKWATTVYGFIEGDSIYDTTQSFADAAGNAQVLRPTGNTAPIVSPLSGLPAGTIQPLPAAQGYGGSHGQMQFSARNSRLGLRVRAPGTDSVRTSALLEMDFLGNQPSGISSTSTFTSPTMRLRHAMFRVETPVVDFLVGQYWHLFGWQEGYMPNTTEIQGVPGQLYSRAPQVRISKTFRGDFATLDLAVAAVRPPSLSEVPEAEGGFRVAFNKWTGMHTAGATGTSIMPLSISVTGDFRYFEIPEASTILPTSMVNTTSGAVAADAFVPIYPAREDKHDNALSLMAQFASGTGISDLYSGMSSGVFFPFVPISSALSGVPASWPNNVDQGLVNYDITQFALHPIQWTSIIGGVEYYLPGVGGKVWISANASHIESSNTSQFARGTAPTDAPTPTAYFYPGSKAQVRKSEDWWDANLFFDPLSAVRIGLEFAAFYDHYADDITATNYRAQASGFFVF
jgi:hypothetical protein